MECQNTYRYSERAVPGGPETGKRDTGGVTEHDPGRPASGETAVSRVAIGSNTAKEPPDSGAAGQ